MESISTELLSNILSYLPKESIAALITTTNLAKTIKELAETNIFWKQRVETLLGRYLNDVFPNWKLINDQLVEIFKNLIDLKRNVLSGKRNYLGKYYAQSENEVLILLSQGNLFLVDGRG